MAISKSRTPANIKVLVEESNLTLEKSDKDSNGRKRQRTKKKKTFQVSRIIKY
jgi:ribosomal protein L19E